MRRVLVGAIAVMGLLAGGCGSSGAHHSSTVDKVRGGSAQAGSLHITDAYVPRPASPATAAAYFTIRNDGDAADSLTRITTPISAMAMLHQYEVTGPGTEKMTGLSRLTLPPHKTVRLMPGKIHIMLESPKRALKAGQTVTFGLVFAHAGRVTITAPVLPIGQTPAS